MSQRPLLHASFLYENHFPYPSPNKLSIFGLIIQIRRAAIFNCDFWISSSRKARFGSFPWLSLGLSTGRSGLGLCPTRNQLNQIGWRSSRPTTDREKPRVESDRARVGSGRLWFRSKYKDQIHVWILKNKINRSTTQRTYPQIQRTKTQRTYPQIQRTKTQRTDPQIHKSKDKRT